MRIYEIYLLNKYVAEKEWEKLIKTVLKYTKKLKKTQLIVLLYESSIRYYIKVDCNLPFTINGLPSFILKKTECFKLNKYNFKNIYISGNKNIIDIYNYFYAKNKGKVECIQINFRSFFNNISISSYLYVLKNNIYKKFKLVSNNIFLLLSVDFSINKTFTYKKSPKYLNINKMIHILSDNAESAVMEVDTFPYLQGSYYLNLNNYNFAKHSLILGSSGSGKSKFIASFIKNIYNNRNFKEKYRVIIIDPHAALEKDIGGLNETKVIDFKRNADSISLFLNDKNNVISSTEILIDVFKSLINNQYNSKLERVLRHSISLLIYAESFNFSNLKKLLLDIEYRNSKVKELEEIVPYSVVSFFLNDFNDLKTKSYGDAIAPIISFIDEIEMLPIFNNDDITNNLKDIVNDNFLSIFSLDNTKLGLKNTKTLALLIMQQLFLLIQSYAFNYHIIFIIDEVAVVESPIISRFLSESRKYNLSLILAGQYLNQISEEVRNSIFANVINYYIFRVSMSDANTLINNFNMEITLDNTKERKLKLLTELNDREMITRVSANGILLNAFKARTMNFISKPRVFENIDDLIKNNNIKHQYNIKRKIILNKNINLKDILIENSASRRVLR